jgi:hypothetical protein
VASLADVLVPQFGAAGDEVDTGIRTAERLGLA